MKKKILVLLPKGIKKGQPSYERLLAFINFYSSNDFNVECRYTPNKFRDKVRLFSYIKKNKIKNILISMPPFTNWWLFLLSGIRIVLDIRDGWSIAIKTGYGGTVKPDSIKALIAFYIERFAIRNSSIIITCTTGLKKYLEKISDKQVLLITNGYSCSDKKLVLSLQEKVASNDVDDNTVVGVCTGQFSEYGRRHVKKILEKLSAEFSDKTFYLKVIGSDIEKNLWVYNWLNESRLHNVAIKFLPRMSRYDMYKEIILSHIGIVVIRDPDYDFGTKVFDYILCKKPVFDYFDERNEFTEFFKKYLSKNQFQNNMNSYNFDRLENINKFKNNLIGL